MKLETQLRTGLEALSLALDDDQVERLLAYLALLSKWNNSFNLTAITDPEKMLCYHLLDSLAIHGRFASGKRVLDVGSGAGLPGLPLAIALPATSWTLLDSNGKKTRFMQQALAHCRVANAVVVKSRVEDYDAPLPLDIIVSRAYASLAKFAESVAHLMQAETLLLTMKTGLEAQEIQGLNTIDYLVEEAELSVPGIAQKRTLVTLRLH